MSEKIGDNRTVKEPFLGRNLTFINNRISRASSCSEGFLMDWMGRMLREVMQTYTRRLTRSTSKNKSPSDVIEHMDSSSHRVTCLSTRKNAPEVMDEKSVKSSREILPEVPEVPEESPSKKKKEIRQYEAHPEKLDVYKGSQRYLKLVQYMN
ncbi:hypothetical protein Fot_11024 [Forsythia ovata]|uniref:Uncharacterized protein n=1 Tax=Forsythia ovata TaxID=205694 RepID=A0ABD1WII0_9LAMI